jgi:hypothetical protein
VLLIESTSSVTEMKASIRASYDAAVASVDLSAGVKYVKDLENVNIKVFALGGDQSMATAMFNGDFDALQDFLTQGADIRTGVPLSYVVRNVLDCGSGAGGGIGLRDVTNGSMRLRAPLSWRDEKSWAAFYGGTIKYYGHVSGGDGWNSVGSDLVIQGLNGTLVFSLPADYPRGLMWQGWPLIIVNLDEGGTVYHLGGGDVTSKWRYGTGSGPEATADQIKTVLANVTDFTIRGDYRAGTDYIWVDEVEVAAGAGGGSSSR